MTTTMMTTGAMTTTTERATRRRGHRPRWFRSLHARLFLAYVVVLTVATLASILVARQALVSRADERIQEALAQEAGELRRLAGGTDPQDGRPFGGRVGRIFETFLARNVPARGEVFITFIGGSPHLRSAGVEGDLLDRDPELVARWSALTGTERGRADTPIGEVEYLAVPLRRGGETRGVFVVAIQRSQELDEIAGVTVALAAVGGVLLVVGSLLAWRMSRRVVAPVQRVTRTAQAISGGDLTRRIDVAGDDEIAELAHTFNDMLDRLEAAFTTQRRFLDDAGHELRTPITIIRGQLELMGDDPEERRETLAIVMDELDRMGRLVEDVLTLAKVERPGFLAPAPVDLAALAAELGTKAAALGPRDWRVEPGAGGQAVLDRQRVTQAVMELAQNAVRHTEDGDRITIATVVREDEVELSVRDTGRGIPDAERERIFDRFARGRGTTRLEGAGLGLAIVRGIAEAHGGRVELESVDGVGTAVTMVVPRRPEGGTAE